MQAMVFAAVIAVALPAAAEVQHGRGEAFLVPTFHCIGIYWSPPEGGPEHKVQVKYRPSGQPR